MDFERQLYEEKLIRAKRDTELVKEQKLRLEQLMVMDSKEKEMAATMKQMDDDYQRKIEQEKKEHDAKSKPN